MSAACPICGFDGRQVSPSDAAVALRSFPRRFTLVLAGPDEDDRPDDVVHRRPAGGGLSALEHAAWAATGIGQAGEAFTAIVYRTEPVVTLPVVDPAPPVPGAGPSDLAPTVVAAVKAAGDGLAHAIEQAPRDGWTRVGLVGDERVTALDVIRLAVHLGAHHLRLAERTMAEVAGQAG